MKKIVLQDDEMPRRWYNVMCDIPNGVKPPLDPHTKQPATPQTLAPIFPEAVIEQEMSQERFIDIPDDVLEILKIWRPSPLIRADNLERALGTKAKIYFKNESVSPVGSHKANSAVAQAYYNKREGVKRLTTETGAGQWGSALSFACGKFALECKVYMVRCSFEQKPYRKLIIQTYGGNVVPSPGNDTETGRRILREMPDTPGSLGIAIAEAVEDAAGRDDSKYALGSVLNHVSIHQSVIGLEAKKQFALVGDFPDVIIGCCGGGSNFAGVAAPFVPDWLDGKKIRFIGAEPASCPTITMGKLAYDYGDVARATPLLHMHTLGHGFIPPGVHAGGLRYHGIAPVVSALVREGIASSMKLNQLECFEAGVLFAKTEGIIPAPESTHAIRAAVIEAMREPDKEQTILFTLSGHGLVDMFSYGKYFGGELCDYDYPEEEVAKATALLPKTE